MISVKAMRERAAELLTRRPELLPEVRYLGLSPDLWLDEDVHLGEWIAACTQAGKETSRPALYRSYRTWCESKGIGPRYSNRAWWAAMQGLGYSVRRSAADRIVQGLELSGAQSQSYQFTDVD